MNDNIVKMTNNHQSEMKIMNENITTMLKNFTAENSKTAKHEEQFRDISSKLSYYKYDIDKLSIKYTQILPFSLPDHKIIDTSSKTDKDEEQLT